MWSWLSWWHPPFLHRLVYVNLISDPDTAISGVIWQVRGRWLVIRKAAFHKGKLPPAKIDGEAVIDRDNVAFVQVMPASQVLTDAGDQ
jgi:hypothetical protein